MIAFLRGVVAATTATRASNATAISPIAPSIS